MSESLQSQNQMTWERDTMTAYLRFGVGASGAVTADSAKGGGLVSVTKETAAGQYSIALAQPFSRLLHVNVTPVLDSAQVGVFTWQILEVPADLQTDAKADGTFKIQFYNAAGSATNLASGSQVLVQVVLRKTTVGPWDN